MTTHRTNWLSLVRTAETVLTGLIITVVLAGCSSANHPQPPKTAVDQLAVVASVNGLPVMLGEFMLFYPEHRARAYAYFGGGRETVSDADFWTAEFLDGTPIDKSIRDTITQVARFKVERAQMARFGIAIDSDFTAFTAALEAENKSRAQYVAAGRPIYGPQQYDAKTYYVYLQTHRSTQLKEALSAGPLVVTPFEISRYRKSIRNPDQRITATDEAIESTIRDQKYESWIAPLINAASITVNKTLRETLLQS